LAETRKMRPARRVGEWGEVVGDEVMTAALTDRVLHHCRIVNIRGNS
jgi:DNA replication protein DnaC